MNQDEIIEMANEAGLACNYDDYPDIWGTFMNVGREEIVAFAHLVAAKERKECAQIAEQKIGKTWAAPDSPKEWWEMACKSIADAIRSRGQA